MMLKVILIAAVAFPTVLTFDSKKSTHEIFDYWKKRSENEHPECFRSTGVTQPEVDKYFDHYQLSSSQNFKCYLKCLYKAFNFINEDGTINRKEFVMDVEKATDEMMDVCETKIVKKTDECERIFEFVDCALHYHHIYE